MLVLVRYPLPAPRLFPFRSLWCRDRTGACLTQVIAIEFQVPFVISSLKLLKVSIMPSQVRVSPTSSYQTASITHSR